MFDVMAERKEKRTKTLSESLENADFQLEPQFTLNSSMSGFVFEPDAVGQGGGLGAVGRWDVHGALWAVLFSCHNAGPGSREQQERCRCHVRVGARSESMSLRGGQCVLLPSLVLCPAI